VARLYQSYSEDSPVKQASPTQQTKNRSYYHEGGARTPGDKADNHVASSSVLSPIQQLKKRRAQAKRGRP